MDALVPVFIAVLLAEMGGRMQAQAHGFALAGMGTGRVLAMIAALALLIFAVSAGAGVLMKGLMPPDGRKLFFALALLFAGVPMLWQRARTGQAEHRDWSAIPRLALGMASDATPFIVLAGTIHFGAPVLCVAAAMTSVMVQALFPALLGRDWPGAAPLTALRIIAAMLLILSGLWQVITALRLV